MGRPRLLVAPLRHDKARRQGRGHGRDVQAAVRAGPALQAGLGHEAAGHLCRRGLHGDRGRQERCGAAHGVCAARVRADDPRAHLPQDQEREDAEGAGTAAAARGGGDEEGGVHDCCALDGGWEEAGCLKCYLHL